MLSLTTHLISCIRFERVYIYMNMKTSHAVYALYILLYVYFSLLRFESNK